MMKEDYWKVLVVGNNPIELNEILLKVKGIGQKKILIEMAFDLETLQARLNHFKPAHIIIDDNVGSVRLHAMVDKLCRSKARNVPITVLKNSNYVETIGSGVMNFILKTNLTSDGLYHELRNSTHFLKLQRFWEKAYGRKSRLAQALDRTFKNQGGIHLSTSP